MQSDSVHLTETWPSPSALTFVRKTFAIEFCDTSSGWDSRHTERMFLPFERLDAVRGGFGLGLAIARATKMAARLAPPQIHKDPDSPSTFQPRRALYRPAALNDPDQEHDDSANQKDVDETSDGVGADHSQKP